ncbi:hypothetical protein ACFWBC_34480, partial [Streptomyces sp. NPDC059985]
AGRARAVRAARDRLAGGDARAPYEAVALLRRAVALPAGPEDPPEEAEAALTAALLVLWAAQRDPELLDEAQRAVTGLHTPTARSLLGRVLYERALAGGGDAELLAAADREFAAAGAATTDPGLRRDCAVRRSRTLIRLAALRNDPAPLREARAALEALTAPDGAGAGSGPGAVPGTAPGGERRGEGGRGGDSGAGRFGGAGEAGGAASDSGAGGGVEAGATVRGSGTDEVNEIDGASAIGGPGGPDGASTDAPGSGTRPHVGDVGPGEHGGTDGHDIVAGAGEAGEAGRAGGAGGTDGHDIVAGVGEAGEPGGASEAGRSGEAGRAGEASGEVGPGAGAGAAGSGGGDADPGLRLALGRVLLALLPRTPDPAARTALAEEATAVLTAVLSELPGAAARSDPETADPDTADPDAVDPTGTAPDGVGPPARVRVELATALRYLPARLEEAARQLVHALDEAVGDPELRLAGLLCLARVHRARYARDEDPVALEEAAEAYGRARRLSPRDGEAFAELLPEWGDVLLERARTPDGQRFVSAAVRVLRESRSAVPQSDPGAAHRLLRLAAGLRLRHAYEGDLVDLREAEHLLELAARQGHGPLERARAWREHGDVQQEIHAHTRTVDRLDRAADSYRRAWRAALEADREDRAQTALQLAARVQELRGEVLERLARPRAALDAYRSALELWQRVDAQPPAAPAAGTPGTSGPDGAAQRPGPGEPNASEAQGEPGPGSPPAPARDARRAPDSGGATSPEGNGPSEAGHGGESAPGSGDPNSPEGGVASEAPYEVGRGGVPASGRGSGQAPGSGGPNVSEGGVAYEAPSGPGDGSPPASGRGARQGPGSGGRTAPEGDGPSEAGHGGEYAPGVGPGPGQVAGHGAVADFGRDTGQGPARDFGRDAGPGAGRDAGHGPARDAGHGAVPDFGPGSGPVAGRDGRGAAPGSGHDGSRTAAPAPGPAPGPGNGPGNGPDRGHGAVPDSVPGSRPGAGDGGHGAAPHDGARPDPPAARQDPPHDARRDPRHDGPHAHPHDGSADGPDEGRPGDRRRALRARIRDLEAGL